MPWKVFWTPVLMLSWKPSSQWPKNAYTLDEATSNDSACGVLASLTHPNFCICFNIIPAKIHGNPWVDDSSGILRILTTGSDRSNREHSLLAQLLPVISVLVEFFRRWGTINFAFFSLRPWRKYKIIPGSIFPNPPLEHSLPVASVLTGSDREWLLLNHYLS